MRHNAEPAAWQPFFFDPEVLRRLAQAHQTSFQQADPFPHVVLENLVPLEVADRILAEFPGVEESAWKRHFHENSRKLATHKLTSMGPSTRQLLAEFNSAAFVAFLEELTGIEGLIPDPHLDGGGVHQIEPQGYLNIHADFNWHGRLKLDRRLNLLLYLNKNWKEAYGGHLELWERSMTRCCRRILPIFNHCVIFATTDFSYHGHPEPLTCPEGWTRKSLALYYYSNGRPAEETSAPHSTLYQARQPKAAPSALQTAAAAPHAQPAPRPHVLRKVYDALAHRLRITS